MSEPISNRRIQPTGDYESDSDDLANTINAHMSDVQNALSQGIARVSNMGCLTWQFKLNVPSDVFSPSFLNSWADFGGGYTSVGYWLDQNNMVHLKGLVKSGTIGAAIFKIPSAYRPNGTEMFNQNTSPGSATARVEVTGAGDVIAQTGSNVWVSLSGIAFRPAIPMPYVASCFPIRKQCTLPSGQAGWLELDSVTDISTNLGSTAKISVPTSLAWSNQGGNISIDNIAGLLPGRTYLITATAWPKG